MPLSLPSWLVEAITALAILAVIYGAVWVVMRAVMGDRFGAPGVPTGSLWDVFEKRLPLGRSKAPSPGQSKDDMPT